MKKFLHLTLAFFAISSFSTRAQVSITNPAIPYTQDFNTLVNTGTSSVLPSGWFLLETGTNNDNTYGSDAGGATAGNTYSYGIAGATERALGSLRSGSLQSSYGVNFVNNSGTIINSIAVNYTGEQWRLGVIGRKDTIHVQYSLDATSLNTGTWTTESLLDFTTPATGGPTGAYVGNNPANQTAVSFTITGLSIPNGASFWIKWVDADATGADDGLAIDDLTINFNGTSIPACNEPATQPTSLILTPTATSISGSFTEAVPVVDEYIVIRSTSSSLSQIPADGVVYSAGQNLGNGKIVAAGSSSSFVDAGLTASIIYYYFVFALTSDACTGGPNYLTTSPLNGNISTSALAACVVPPASPTNLNLTPSNNSISGSFTAAPGANRYLVVISTSNSLGATPTNGVTYTQGQSLGTGTVVSYGSSTNFVATGLTVSTAYYFFVFAANGDCSGEPLYRTVSLNGNISTTNTSTGIPPGYYNAASGLVCAQLKTALKTIIRNNSVALTYTPGVWDAIKTTDMHRNDANTADIVWDIYSDNPTGPEPYEFTYKTEQCGEYAGEGDCYNREHSFPQEWFGSKQYPMYSDMHHVFPTDGFVNGKHDSNPYGEVSSPTWTSLSGSKLGPNTFPGFTGTVFEPIDAYKGDIARAQLYMVTRYEDSVAMFNGNGNASAILDGLTYPSLDNWYIQLLYKWHLQDPVSQKEIDRNNAIYALQGNRNPYVDHPEYVEMVWRCSVIPVTLIDFNAKKQNNTSILSWVVTNEINFKNYTIEKSNDGIHFYQIGTVAATNRSNYSFTDDVTSANGNIYYRLQMNDLNGKSSYSKIISLTFNENTFKAGIYPNPVTDVLNIRLQNSSSLNSNIRVLDVTGRTIITKYVAAGQNNISIDVRHLPAGKYFVSILTKETILNESFVIIK